MSISSEIVAAVKEYERSATTAVNAYVAPLLTNYLRQLQRSLGERGLGSPLYVMQSMGGAMRALESERRSVNTLASGPAGGVVASRFLGRLLEQKNIICADVGGTSFDVGLWSMVNQSSRRRPLSTSTRYSRRPLISFRSALAAVHRMGRSGTAQSWPAQRRCRSGAGVLRARGSRANRHRCQRGPRLYRSGLFPGR